MVDKILVPVLLFAGAVLGFILALRPFSGRALKEGRGVHLFYVIAVGFLVGFLLTVLLPHVFLHTPSAIPAFAFGAVLMGLVHLRLLQGDACCEVPLEGGSSGGGAGPEIGAPASTAGKGLGRREGGAFASLGQGIFGSGARGRGGLTWASVLAMGICSVNDGFLLGLAAPPAWSGMVLGMVLHKFTSSFAAAYLLSTTGARPRALLLFGLFQALLSPFTFLLGLLSFGGSAGSALLGFSSGILAYAVTVEMVPQAVRHLRRGPSLAYALIGSLGLSLFLGSLHDEFHEKLDHEGHGREDHGHSH